MIDREVGVLERDARDAQVVIRLGDLRHTPRLLDAGVSVRIDPRWDAVIAASAAITATPASFDGTHIAALREVGLDDGEIVDVINAAAFFNWANRLMLSLGEPAGDIRRP